MGSQTVTHDLVTERECTHNKKLRTCRRLDNSILQNFHPPVPTSLPNPPIPLTHTPHQKPGSVQFSSVAQSCPTLCDPMNCSMPGLQLPEFTQTHVHWVSDVIQPSHPLWYPSPTAFIFLASGFFQMRQLFGSCGQSVGLSASASILPNITQDWSPLGWTGWISLQSKGLQESSPTPQFKSLNS